mmetsp:Transcript_2306/g.2581  ORF Transcript_2306/g.2581 Transcript_2306/m.2581 type:complete len:306 (+) Transcript_2306:29-946(+)
MGNSSGNLNSSSTADQVAEHYNVDLTDKVALVTGSNVGIGFETVRVLVKHHARVIMACRNLDKAREAAAKIKELIPEACIDVSELDLASLASVRRCATKLLEEETKIDLLILNAGIMGVPQGETEDGFERHMGVNHYGHFLFANMLLPLVKKVPNSRIISVSSLAHEWGQVQLDDMKFEKRKYGWMAAYGASKTANILFTVELQRQLAEEGSTTTINALMPGVVRTNLFREFGIFQLAMSLLPFTSKTPNQGAATTMYCACAPELRGVGGNYYENCKLTTSKPYTTDPQLAKDFWALSKKMVGLE